MIDVLFSIVLFILSLLMILVSKCIVYKLFKLNDCKKNIYLSSFILTLVSFIMFALLTYIVSKGNGFEFSDNLSSFSLVYMVSLIISVIINCICEINISKNNKWVYVKKKSK